ncbi:MAG: extracellular solute-binding protein [Candidatus Dormibacteria bacterium]
MKVFIAPFEKKTGIQVQVVSPVNFAGVQAQVAAGHDSVDLVEFSSEFASQYCGTVLQPIAQYFNMAQYYPQYVVSKCGVPESTFLHEFFYNKKDFPTNPPTTWADLFNTTKYPGTRAFWNSGDGTNFEQAMLAAGATSAKVDPINYTRALSEFDRIRSHIVYWSTPAQAIQMMQSGSVAIMDGWGPFSTDAVISGATDYVREPANPIFLYNQFMIPKGAPDVGAALEFIKFATAAAQQLQLVETYPEGPTNTAVHPTHFANAVLKKFYPGNYISTGVYTNVAWRSIHFTQMETEWTNWVQGTSG